MSREVRAIAAGWEHPRGPGAYASGKPRYRPLYSRDSLRLHQQWHADDPDEWGEPDPAGYMPEIPEGAPFRWVLYETVTEGTPQSPPFETLEELANWCEDGATAFGSIKWTRHQWLESFKSGTTGTDSMLAFGPGGFGTVKDVFGDA